MSKYLVIGHPVAHSLSPEMQNAAFRLLGFGTPYGKLDVAPEDLREFTAAARGTLAGFNATIPHKQALLPLVDEADDLARITGSINTVKVVGGRLIGTSTDGVGIERALLHCFGECAAARGGRFLFLGAGGAARAAAFHLALAGAERIAFANRTVERAEELAAAVRRAAPSLECSVLALGDAAALRRELEMTQVVIQATSLGLHPGDPPPFDPALLTPGMPLVFMEMVYRTTAFHTALAAAGFRVADGAEMLIGQGAASFEYWTGLPAPVGEMRRALRAAADARG